MTPLGILQVVPQLEGGGVEEEILLLCHILQQAGHHPMVATQGGRLVSRLEEKGIVVATLPLATKNPLKMLTNAFHLRRLVTQHAIDLLHVHSRAPAWSVALCARLTGLFWMTTYHAAYQGRGKLKRFYNSIMARGHRVVTISQFIHHHVLQTYSACKWFDPSHVGSMARGIDTEFFHPQGFSPPPLEALRASLGIPFHTPVVLMPARFSPLKGHHVLLKALALLKAQGKAAHVLFVGGKGKEDPFQKDLEQRAIQQNVEENVSFVPFTADLRPFYALATCVVVPSVVPEGFGRVIGEAMACGRVVIASHHGAASELLQDPEKGGGQEGALEQLFRPGDSQHLADLLAQVLALSPQERDEKGKRARLRIQQHFSLHAFRESTLALYEACAASCNTFPSVQGNL